MKVIDELRALGIGVETDGQRVVFAYPEPKPPADVALPLIEELATLVKSERKPEVIGELLQWDDHRERERLRRAYAWCDAEWWRGAWEWCRASRGDFYRRLDDTLLDIDAAFGARDVRENARACEALKLVVADIITAYRDAQQMNGTGGGRVAREEGQ